MDYPVLLRLPWIWPGRTEAMKITDPHRIDRTALFLEIGGPAVVQSLFSFSQQPSDSSLGRRDSETGSPAAGPNEKDE